MLVPNFPRGDLRRIYLHWTGGDYRTVYPAYHFCVALDVDGSPLVATTNDVCANMRDVRADAAALYAAHTAGRNSHALGLAVCGMLGATPADFGSFPLRDEMLDAFCGLAARACVAYAIPIDAKSVMTHAEAALLDGYYGSAEGERWDIARLVPDMRPLEPDDATRTGELLRARIRAFASGRMRTLRS